MKSYYPYYISILLLWILPAIYPVYAADGPLISAGLFHTCAIKEDASVQCWGRNDAGEADPPGGTFLQISAGAHFTCGVRTDNTAACWGFNSLGQASPPQGTFKQVSAATIHACGVRTDGTVSCWGANHQGQGNAPSGTFTQVSAAGVPSSANYTGRHHTCGLRSDSTISCWGDNLFGQTDAPSGTYVQVSASEDHSCALRTDGAVVCWGDNDFGQSDPPSGAFVQISTAGSRTTDLGAPFGGYSCGVRKDNTLDCWGDDFFGQATPPSGAFAQVSAGFKHACGMRDNGDFVCWGFDDTGRSQPPTEVFNHISSTDAHVCGLSNTDGAATCWGWDRHGQSSPPAGVFSQLSAGFLHSCGLRKDTSIVCWGDDTFDQSSPPSGTFTQVSIGVDHSCALRSDNTAICWGRNKTDDGETTGQIDAPNGTFKQISAGQFHSCGVLMDDTLKCWGDDSFGQSSAPNGTFTQVSAADRHTCALQTNGAILCWGNNEDGQSQAPAGSFSQVSTGGNRLGKGHSCGLRSDNTIQCWGWNRFGQATPPGGEFMAVEASSHHTCGLRPSGLAECWGYNGDGFAVVPEGLSGDPNLIQPPTLDFLESLLLNISTNGPTNGFGMRAGFIVQGQNQRFVILGEDMGGMQNPLLKLFDLSDNTLIEQNDDWQSHPTAGEVQSTLREPGNSRDGAFAVTLAQGLYYAELQDKAGGGQGLVSVTATGEANLQQTYPINLSTRGPSPLTAGFIVTGDASRCFVIKAEGPFLDGSAISDPALIVRRYDPSHAEGGEIIDANNNWADHPSAPVVQAGGFTPQIPQEAALALRLDEGLYLAELYSVFADEASRDSIVAVTELPESALKKSSCDSEPTPNPAPIVSSQNIEAHISQPINRAYYSGQAIPYVGEVIGVGNNATYQWDFGSNAQLSAGNSANARAGLVRYGQEGTKTIKLTVTANGLSHSAQTTVRIRSSREGEGGK